MHTANAQTTTVHADRYGQDERWLSLAVAASGEGWALVNAAGRVEAVAGSVFDLLDTPRPQALTGARLREILRALRSDEQPQWPPAAGSLGWCWTGRRQDGRDIRIEAHALCPDTGSDGAVPDSVWALRVRWASQVVQDLPSTGPAGALYHPATRLPQQSLLIDRLQQAVERSQRTVTQRFAVVLAYHEALEAMERESLRAVARQLEEAIRPADTVAHLDRETLAIIMEPVRGDDATVRIAIDSMLENFRRALDELPGDHALGKDVSFSVAIGDGSSHPSDLLALARTRLVRRTVSRSTATVTPGNTYTDIGGESRRQPTVAREYDPRTGQSAGLILHLSALPAADDLIALLSDRQCAAVVSEGSADAPLHLVIALDNLPQVDTLPRLLAVVQSWRAETTLTLELDEAAIAHDPEAAIQVIDAAARRGVGIGIGRFGINQCTDGLIARLPLSRLTLDPDLVTDARNAAQDRIRLAATIAWAHDRGLAVVAGGVTDRALATLVSQLGCDFARGPAFQN